MTHRTILEQFNLYFPQFSREVESWSPHGKNTIRIRSISRREYIYKFNGMDDWSLETIDSFINRMDLVKKLERSTPCD